jgi:mRNA interferase RelE/StbE
VSSYTVYVTPAALDEAKRLPGHVRQRVKRAIDNLETEPRPPESKPLEFPEAKQPTGIVIEVRRLRFDKWRVLYTICEADKVVDVLAIRKRPPYDYGDLEKLLPEAGADESPSNS